jgi:hypothetical protein
VALDTVRHAVKDVREPDPLPTLPAKGTFLARVYAVARVGIERLGPGGLLAGISGLPFPGVLQCGERRLLRLGEVVER